MAMSPKRLRPKRAAAAAAPTGTPASLLLHFDGNFNDSSNNNLAVSAGSNATISTTEFRHGSGSASFVAEGCLTVQDSPVLNLQSGDWTVELWWRPLDLVTGSNIIAINADQVSYAQVRMSQTNEGAILLTQGYDANYWINVSFVPLPEANRWYHLAATRSGNVFRFFIDGQKVNEYQSSVNLRSPTGAHAVGGLPNHATANGYIDEVRIVKGLAVYEGPFIPPASPLSAYATPVPVEREASLLINFDGSFADSSPSPVTVTSVGSAAISTATKKFGSGAGYFPDGGENYATVASPNSLSPGNSSFTAECWVRFDATPTGEDTATILNFSTFGGLSIYYDAGKYNYQSLVVSDRLENQLIRSWVPSPNVWYHVAVCRNGNAIRAFVDGIPLGDAAPCNVTYASAALQIGSASDGSDSPVGGHIDDLRFVKGLAVYAGPFTPPAAPLSVTATPVPGTYTASLLLNFDGSFVDDGIDAVQASFPAGAVAISSTEKKFGSGAARFSGTYITFQNAPNLALGSGDFTVEAWIHRVGSGQGGIFGQPGGGLALAIDSTGFLIADQANVGGSPLFSSTAVPLGQWCHVAVTRNGGYATLFLNGQIVDSGNWLASLSQPQGSLVGNLETSGLWQFDGYMDGLRVTKACLYCGPFTPPSQPPANTATTFCFPAAPPSCEPYGTYIRDECQGCDYGTVYADGNCGEYFEVISYEACC